MLLQLVIIQIITFFAIVFVLKKLLYAETQKEAARLKVLKEENAGKEKELQEKISTADGAYREKIAKAEEEIRLLRAKTEEEADEAGRRITDRAKIESEEILKAAFNTKDKIRDEITLEMRKKLPVMASAIFKEALSPEAVEHIHAGLVKDVLKQVKKIDGAKFKIKISKGELISAFPITKGEASALTEAVCGRLGYKISFIHKDDRKLIAGVVIRLGTLVIDGSLDYRLRRMEEDLRKHE